MLHQASAGEVHDGTLSRRDGLIAITMRTYPRQIRKDQRDEYLVDLSPEPALFRDFKEAERRLGDHDAAFAEVDYERRFTLGGTALIDLERLAKAARDRDVFLVCQCAKGMRCHRELLLLIARHAFDAEVGRVAHAYPVFAERLAASPLPHGRISRYPRSDPA